LLEATICEKSKTVSSLEISINSRTQNKTAGADILVNLELNSRNQEIEDLLLKCSNFAELLKSKQSTIEQLAAQLGIIFYIFVSPLRGKPEKV
jgi:hypothetical protein